MASRQLRSRNLDSDSISIQPSFYTQSSEQQSHQESELPSSSSHQAMSSSHDVYVTNKKHQRKKKKSKSQNKSKSKSKTKNQQTIKKISITKVKQEHIKTQKPKSQLTLNKFLGKKSQDQQSEVEQQIIPTYNLSHLQAGYLNYWQFLKGYSLQRTDQKNPKGKKASGPKQRNLDNFVYDLKKEQKNQNSDEDQQDRVYFASYFVVKTIIKQLLESEKVPKFFKQPIDEIICSEVQKEYYKKYTEIIKNKLLDLKTLDQMVEEQDIKNLLQFEEKFNEMVTNSIIFHTFKNDEQMLKASVEFRQMYHKLWIQLTCPQMNEYEKSSIKTTSFKQQPKSKKILVEGQEKEIQYMDLRDLLNQNRIKYMNQFLKNICDKNPQNLYTFISRIRSLILRYTNDRVKVVNQPVVKNQMQKQRSISLSKNLSQSKSINSQNSQNDQIYQISIQCISVSLFLQLKELIKNQWREIKRKQSLGEQPEEIYRNRFYPHDDSDSFDLDDYS